MPRMGLVAVFLVLAGGVPATPGSAAAAGEPAFPGGAAPAPDLAAAVKTAPAPATVTPELLAEFHADPESFFFDLRHLEGIACAARDLADSSAPPARRAAALRVSGEIYAALDAGEQARAAFRELFHLDPTAELEPATAYPPVVVRLFYAVKDDLARQAGLDDRPGASPAGGIQTVAVGPLDNMSPKLPGQKLDMDRFAAGLTQLVASDLQPATSLRIVDRQRLNVLRSEIELSNSSLSDPGTAVKAGRLLGAQSYLFGGVTMVGDGLVRIDLRLVQTETGAVLLAASREMKVRSGSDLLKLEREVVNLLAAKLDEVAVAAGAPRGSVTGGARQALDGRKKTSEKALELLDLTGAAILAEDSGQVDSAFDYWTQVSRIDPANSLAQARIQALDTQRRYASLEGAVR